MSHNPYAAPTAELIDAARSMGDAIAADDAGGEPTRRPAGAGVDWIKASFRLVLRQPGIWIAAMLLTFAVTFGFSLVGGLMSVVPVIGIVIYVAVTFASYLIGPFLLAAFVNAARVQVRGEALGLDHFIAGITAKPKPMLMIGVYYAIALVVLVIVVMTPFALLFGFSEMFGVGDPATMAAASDDPQRFLLITLLMVLVFFALALPIIMAYWFAPALVLTRDISAFDAMKLSFRACLKNWLPFLVYGLLMLPIFFIAALPLLLGLLIAAPAALAANYIAFRDIFGSHANA